MNLKTDVLAALKKPIAALETDIARFKEEYPLHDTADFEYANLLAEMESEYWRMNVLYQRVQDRKRL